jgi:hypothetical protein
MHIELCGPFIMDKPKRGALLELRSGDCGSFENGLSFANKHEPFPSLSL